jgi:hypothetical protein
VAIKERREAIFDLLDVSAVTSLLHAAPASRSTSIFHEQAPDDAEPPYIIFDKQNGRPDLMTFKDGHEQNDVWLIKAVVRGSAVTAENIADAIYNAVHDKSVTVNGSPALWLRREMDVDYWEDVEGDRWDHVGFQFRLVSK